MYDCLFVFQKFLLRNKPMKYISLACAALGIGFYKIGFCLVYPFSLVS